MGNHLDQFLDQKYINLETYKKDGTSVRTPVWFVIDNDLIYVITRDSTGKVKDGVVLAVEEKSRDLQVEDITQKIFQVDDHIGIAAAGYIPDARVMVDSARFFSQSNKLTYDESVEIETVAKHLADQSHQFTQYSSRPFHHSLDL